LFRKNGRKNIFDKARRNIEGRLFEQAIEISQGMEEVRKLKERKKDRIGDGLFSLQQLSIHLKK